MVITRDGLTQEQELPGNVPVLYADGSEVSMFEDLVSVPSLVGMRELDLCQHFSDQFEPICPDQDDISVSSTVSPCRGRRAAYPLAWTR